MTPKVKNPERLLTAARTLGIAARAAHRPPPHRQVFLNSTFVKFSDTDSTGVWEAPPELVS